MNEQRPNPVSFWTSRIALYLILGLFGLIVIFPLIFMMIASLKTPTDYRSNPRRLLPFTQENGSFNGQPARLYEFEVDGDSATYVEAVENAEANRVNKVNLGFFARPSDLQDALDENEHSTVAQSQTYIPVLEVPLRGIDASADGEFDLRDAGTSARLTRRDETITRGTKFDGATQIREYSTYDVIAMPPSLQTDAISLNTPSQPLMVAIESAQEEGVEVESVSLNAYGTADFGDELEITATGESMILTDSTGDEDDYDVFNITHDGETEQLLLVSNPALSVFVNVDDSSEAIVAFEDNNRRAEFLEFQVENYNQLFELENFDRSLINTIFVTVLVVLGQVTTSVMGGYAFSRIRFAGRDTLFLLYLGSIMIPFVVLIVPMYRLMVEIGWQERIVSLIIPWIFTAYGTFLMRQFFMSIPVEIEEAALLDGAGRMRILWQIFVPLSTPAIATQAIFTFLYAWNSFLWPLFMFGDQPSDSRVLTLSLISLANRASSGEPNLVFTGAAVTILPPVIVFILAQKYFVEGVATSGLKG
jgi:ABC-type glycerol-3-phosphate transport system permease component